MAAPLAFIHGNERRPAFAGSYQTGETVKGRNSNRATTVRERTGLIRLLMRAALSLERDPVAERFFPWFQNAGLESSGCGVGEQLRQIAGRHNLRLAPEKIPSQMTGILNNESSDI